MGHGFDRLYLVKDSILLYDVWVHSKGKYPSTKGALYYLNDTFILIKPSFTFPGKITDPHQINISDIDLIQIREKNKVRRSTAMGFAVGVASGVITVFAINSGLNSIGKGGSFFNPQSVVFGFAGGLAGAVVGKIIGSFKINLPINRNQAQYQKEKKRLECMLFD